MIDLIERGSTVDCDELPEAGTEARLILFNYDQVEYIRTLEGMITEIGLSAGAVGYEFLGFRQDVKKSEEVISGDLKNRFRHLAEFVVYEVSQDQKNNLKKLSKGRFITIIENNGKDEDAFELLGREAGLKLTTLFRDVWQNSGIYSLQLSTPENELERKLPQSFNGTYQEISDYIDTLLDSSPWILADGSWDDDGIWIDTEVWID